MGALVTVTYTVFRPPAPRREGHKGLTERPQKPAFVVIKGQTRMILLRWFTSCIQNQSQKSRMLGPGGWGGGGEEFNEYRLFYKMNSYG